MRIQYFLYTYINVYMEPKKLMVHVTLCRTSCSVNTLSCSTVRRVTQLPGKLSGNLQRELWALRGLGEIAPLAVLSGGAAGPRQCST